MSVDSVDFYFLVDEKNREYVKQMSLNFSAIFIAAINKIEEQEKEIEALRELLKQKENDSKIEPSSIV